MFQLKKAKDYEKALSEKYNISRKDTKKIINYFFINLVKSFLKGHIINIPFFGQIRAKRK